MTGSETTTCSGSRLKPGVLAIDALFRLELNANDGTPMLTLSANELAIDGASSHSIVVGSR